MGLCQQQKFKHNSVERNTPPLGSHNPMRTNQATFWHVFYLDEYYHFGYHKPYPDALEVGFRKHQDPGGIHGVFWFVPKSNEEKRFVDYCVEQGIGYKRFNLLAASQKQIVDNAFYLLIAADACTSVRNPFPYEELFEYSSPCLLSKEDIPSEKLGGGNGCGFVKGQALKISLDVHQMRKHLDLMSGGWSVDLYVVSRRLRNFLKDSNFTGFRFVPCLDTKRDYPSQYRAFDATDTELDDSAEFYQLVITAKTRTPMHFGIGFRREKACERCGVLINASANIYTQYFPANGLGSEDIQMQCLCQLPDGRVLHQDGQMVYISGRLLRALLKEKFKGIQKFMSMKSPPKIDYWQVRVLPEG